MFSSKGVGGGIIAKVLNPRSRPMHVSLHCGHVSWWFITGNKTHRQIILWQEAGESSVCGGRAGVRSTFSATINERSHAKFTLSLLLGPSIRQAQVSLACSLTASKANRQKSKPDWQTVFVTLHHNMGTKTQWGYSDSGTRKVLWHHGGPGLQHDLRC